MYQCREGQLLSIPFANAGNNQRSSKGEVRAKEFQGTNGRSYQEVILYLQDRGIRQRPTNVQRECLRSQRLWLRRCRAQDVRRPTPHLLSATSERRYPARGTYGAN